jgi:biopolymer transport protein ExbD
MMIAPSRRKSGLGNDDNVIPLINVVFLMLIFFMIAGQISKSDAVKTLPPESINDQRIADVPGIELLVASDGALFIDDRPVDMAQLSEQVSRAFRQAGSSDRFQVTVKADRALPVSRLQSVLGEIGKSGIVRVSLVTQLAPAPVVGGA